MTLTVGTGPFGERPSGRFDFEPPDRVTFVEVHRPRVRALKDGQTVVDSTGVRLVYRTGSLPVFAFPADDVRIDATREPAIDGYVTVEWGAVDAWFEEDDEIVVHPRDPYHRIDVVSTSRSIVVRVDGAELAATTEARLLLEAGLPPRYYLPREDVRVDLLSSSEVRTGCAYKGFPVHFDHGRSRAVAWSYTDPRPDAERVRDRICFYQEREAVELRVDGVPVERPTTPWADTSWI